MLQPPYFSLIVLIQTIQFCVNIVFAYTRSNIKTVLSQTIQFIISMNFVLFDPIRGYHSGPEWTKELRQWRGILHFPKLQYYWSLTIRLFSVISGRSLWGVTPLQRYSQCILQPQLTGHLWLFRTHQLRLVLPSSLRSITFFCSLAKIKYLSLFLFSLIFTHLSVETTSPLFGRFTVFFFNYHKVCSSVGIRWSVCITKSQRMLRFSFSMKDCGLFQGWRRD